MGSWQKPLYVLMRPHGALPQQPSTCHGNTNGGSEGAGVEGKGVRGKSNKGV